MTGLTFTVDAALAPHLAAALRHHLRRLRESGIRAPEDLVALADWAGVVVRGLSTPLPEVADEDAPVAQQLLSLPEVADELGCSASKVKKLVADGRLATVDFDGVRRVHRDDLEVFLQALRSRRMGERLEAKGPAPARSPGTPGRRRDPATLEAS